MPAVLDGSIEALLRQILGVRAVPYRRIVRAGNIHAAPRPNRFCQSASFSNVCKILTAFHRIRVKHVFPGTHFCDDHLCFVESLAYSVAATWVRYLYFRAVCRTVTQASM